MPRCAFLTMDNLEEFEAYDDLLLEPLSSLSWTVDMVSWRQENVDWDSFEAVIIRSPWDYQQDPERFMEVLEAIDNSSAKLENPLSVVKWNINKTYLRELEEQGVLIVSTLWGDHFEQEQLDRFFSKLETNQIIIKPVVSANADDTFRVANPVDAELASVMEKTFDNRDFMVQPFMRNIINEGEFSLFYFGEEYSHTILKTPKPDDFRVQEEHGGRLSGVDPEPGLLYRAEQTMECIHPQPLYARADYVRTDNNDFALMELELIEPSLYFNMDPDSPARFARIFDEWMKKRSSLN